MADRTTYKSTSPGALTGDGLLDNIAAHIGTLYDNAAIKLTSVGGTANAVTATLDPVLDVGGLKDGMKFTLTWAAANTGGVTLKINTGGAVAVLDKQGNALVAGAVASGLRSLIEYVGGSFRLLSAPLAGVGAGGGTRFRWLFTASGTWAKPSGLSDDTLVFAQVWAAGGGGQNTAGGGGGGGAYKQGWFRLGDLPSSVAVTVGAGGPAQTAGGSSSFGTLITAYGGGSGGNASGYGGGGGGLYATGGSGVNTGAAPAATDPWGGGGGAAQPGRDGGAAVYGGGGGGSSGGTSGGQSQFGGNGGGNNTAGSAPGGGGGGSGSGSGGAGARGEVRIWI